ncbi:hypothetical protein K2X05_13420, partial [bacterium]|nr:hypothetical protein [bacterium]
KDIYTEDQWYEHLEKWENKAPPSPGLLSLFKAHQTYKKELSTAQKLKNDKKKHCYIGCRIAQDTSLDVSTYVGWLKESEDIQDCDKKTFFEPLDFKSTVDGAEQAVVSSEPSFCFDYCQDYKAPQKRSEL